MSRIIQLERSNDFDEWRDMARSLCNEGVPPEEVLWVTPETGRDLFGAAPVPDARTPPGPIRANKAFIDIARRVICLRDTAKFARLYRLLWHLQFDPKVMAKASDPDVAWVTKADKAIRRDVHKMHAFVRFRKAGERPDGREQFAAWFEPSHLITEIGTPFFKRRFPNMDWMIVTPDRTALWDGEALTFCEGGQKSDVPSEDAIEDQWKQYFLSIFNPARLKVDAMMSEMPKKYWKNMPESDLIPGMIEAAQQRTKTMQASAVGEKNPLADVLAQRRAEDEVGVSVSDSSTSLEEVAQKLSRCERCALHACASQAVPGEGLPTSRLMIVGEQPGDHEDIQGRPFIGPAGQLLDLALSDAAIIRSDTYVTNAVKHFKFTTRGKRRIHAKPSVSEIDHCRWWLNEERRLVEPQVIVALGATAARAILGRAVKISEVRGQAIALDEACQLVVTVHPSYLLRLPDEAEKQRERALFVNDLRFAHRLIDQGSARQRRLPKAS